MLLVIPASLEEVITLRDPELNKEKEKYDHDKIQISRTTVLQDQDKLYTEVKDEIYESLQLHSDHEESFKIDWAALPDPARAKKEAELGSMKKAHAE